MRRLLVCTRSLSTPAGPVKNVSVLGSGLMGSGIAQVAAQSGFTVTLWDLKDELVEQARVRVRKNVQRVAAKASPGNEEATVTQVMGRITFTSALEVAARSPQLVVEAIVENLAIKQGLFARLDKLTPASTIFASNTSSLEIGHICNGIRPKQFGGVHFFNPVPVMKLAEIIRTKDTSDATHATLRAFSTDMGKTPVDCRDTPGFIVNRLLVPFLVEAVRMLERGDASAEDIDTAMRLGAAHPMGPLTLADYVGLDTTQFILKGWASRFPHEPSFKPCPTLDKLVSAGKLGVKSGEGFYKYDASGKKI